MQKIFGERSHATTFFSYLAPRESPIEFEEVYDIHGLAACVVEVELHPDRKLTPPVSRQVERRRADLQIYRERVFGIIKRQNDQHLGILHI